MTMSEALLDSQQQRTPGMIDGSMTSRYLYLVAETHAYHDQKCHYYWHPAIVLSTTHAIRTDEIGARPRGLVTSRPVHFSVLDYLIGGLYFLLVPALGIYAGRKQKGLGEYFLAGRQIPWWAVWLSIIAAETSAVTFIAVPARAYKDDWTYLATAFG